MINLLSPQQKDELLQEKTYRLFLISGVLVIIFWVSLSLAFFAVKIYISGKVQGEKILASPQIQVQESNILAINKDIKDLNGFYKNRPSFTGLLEKISQILPSGVSLNSISLNYSEKEGFLSTSLGGFSPTREALLQLKKKLESDEIFKNINFPPSNWVKPEDIEFSLNFLAQP